MTDDPTAANPQSVGRLAAFRYRDFRLFWFSLFISNVGTWMPMTATNSLLWKGAALLGPTFGGIAIAAMGTAGAFYANAVSFLAVVVALLFMRAPSPARERQRDFLAETKAGFSYIVSQPVILGLTVMEAFASVFGLDHAMLTILASDVFRVGAHGFGFLQSSRGVGAVIGWRLFLAI